MIKLLSIKEVEYLAFRLAKENMSFDEPIPEFSTRFPNILESCLETPFQNFSRRPLYKGLPEKAAVLFYLLIKNHPFKNGNKRIAMTTLMAFLFKNNKWIKVDNTELYNFAMWVAQSPRGAKEETITATANFIQKHVVNVGKD
ncbi:type II toxin-antitoxin system death-on-curing family toxin [Patescibacteria group bacterium]|nr:type II toxin-antitoxin system death-on-curing family toxin [Patescibacteria group bacterium]